MPRPLRPMSHIVLVDARPQDYRNIAVAAARSGWNLHFLTSGAAAVHFTPRGHSALWIVNVRLPDMSGLELIEMLREQQVGGRVFAIADEYHANEESMACRSGADFYLCKGTARTINCEPILEALAAKDRSVRSPPFLDSYV